MLGNLARFVVPSFQVSKKCRFLCNHFLSPVLINHDLMIEKKWGFHSNFLNLMSVLVASKSRQRFAKNNLLLNNIGFISSKGAILGETTKNVVQYEQFFVAQGWGTQKYILKSGDHHLHASLLPTAKKVCIPGLCSKKAVPFTPANQKTTSNPQKKTHKLSKSPSPFPNDHPQEKQQEKKSGKNRHLWRKSIATEIFQYFPITWNLDLPPQAVRNFFNSKEWRKKFTKNNIGCSKVFLYTRNVLPKNHQKIPHHFLEKDVTW